jgi:hypothetical protein
VTKVTDGGLYELSLVKRGTKNRWKATLNALSIERATRTV